MSMEVQWAVCGVILVAALLLLYRQLWWAPRRGAAQGGRGCGGSCLKCSAVEQMAKRLEQLR